MTALSTISVTGPSLTSVTAMSRLEHSRLDAHTQSRTAFDKMIVQLPGLIGGRRVIETGPAALAAIAVKRELRDRQHRAAGIQQAAIHLAGIIVKDAQVNDFAGQEFRVRRVIRAGNPQQYQHTRADFPPNGSLHLNLRVSNTLDHRTHTGECTLTD